MSHRRGTLGALNIHRDASGSKLERSENLKQQAALRRGAGLVRDLIAQRTPVAARRDAVMDVRALARDIAAGRLTIGEARAQLHGAA